MSATPELQLDLDTLKAGLPGITPEIGALFAQASRISFYRHAHAVDLTLEVTGDFTRTCKVRWSDQITTQRLDAWHDQQEATKFGACGVAILLTLALTKYTVIRRAVKGVGIDYWLGQQDALPPFQNAARLEISGILTGDRLALQRRAREKQRQTLPTDGSLPVHIVIVEFSQPTALFQVKS